MNVRKLTQKPVWILLLLLSISVNAQNSLWQQVAVTETQSFDLEERNSTPTTFDVYKLDTQNFKEIIQQAPERFRSISSLIIPLPIGNGQLQNFRIYEASIFEAGLQAKYPDIRSYVGQGIDDPTATARFSISPFGVNIMISSVNYATVYIDPFTKDKTHYITYSRADLPEYDDGFYCLVDEAVSQTIGPIDINTANRNPKDGKLRTFRLALACTGEYANFHLNRQGVSPSASDADKKAAVLNEMNVAMTRVNGIYERDLGISMNIINNNDLLIFLNPSTDPYTNHNGNIMLGQNQATVDNLIGNSNYDIGHVLSTGGGGIAQLRSPCVPGMKARGVTGLPQPINDPFYIDYISHEMGHQFGGNHTFNNSCQGNRNPGTAVEPGSGSTILSYAGICPPNIKNRSDDYFHAITIAEIWSNISAGQGTCGAQTNTNNQPPIANTPANVTIPKSTPFILEGSAIDPDDPTGASLTYTWEQMNPQQAQMPPQNTSVTGPLFRSFPPTNSPVRYMPSIQAVINGNTQTTWEVVPSVGRTMNFRFTVRDNHPGGGASDHSNMTVSVDGNAGPFVVTSHNTPSTWTTQTQETITWDVAGTNAGAINCATVDVFFSTNGGLTYPITIATGLPNTGSAVINVPNLNTNAGRFMVRGGGHIFYDINDAQITVTGIINVEDFSFDEFAIYPNPTQGTFSLKLTPDNDAPITISIYDIRGRLIASDVYEKNNNNVFYKDFDLNHIESGVYFILVKNGDKKATKKLIKN